MKPVPLISKLIENSSKRNQSVLDLFGGSGTTLIACEQLNRRCFMMEIEPKHVDTIINRWEKFTGKKAVKISE
jgi:DNA modification methylase